MTTDFEYLEESATAPVKKGKRWYVTIARPGKGSNGEYTEEVLKRTGPIAVPKGTKSYFKHAKSEDRDPRDQVGVYEEGAFWNEDEGELGAYLTPFPRYANVLEEAGPNIEASIHVAARKDARTNVVRELVYSRGNTVDLVAFAGIEGSGLKYQVESLFEEAAADFENLEESKENNVDITKEMWDAQTNLINGFINKFDTFVTEAKAEVKGVVDEAAVEAAVSERLAEALVDYAEVVKSIEDAKLPEKVSESLKDKAAKGEDITSALADAVELVNEARKDFVPDPKTKIRGNVVVVDESLDSAPKSYKVGRWAH